MSEEEKKQTLGKLRLKGGRNSTFPLKVKKIDDKGKEFSEKVHLTCGNVYDSKQYNLIIDEVKEQMGANFDESYDEKEEEINELTESLKRLQAEFENFKKRAEKEKSEFMKYAHADLIASILPVIDSFEIALKNTNDKEKFIEGIKMIYAQIHSILNSEGLKPINTAGQMFDPYKHEVLMKEESDKPEGTILEEFQKGYMLNDRVVRHSKVKVSGK
jgi:molecular chaperone GrpE (heat shock protein)